MRVGENFDADDARWADIGHIADRVRQHIKNGAYIYNGGTNGCAQCTSKGRDMAARIAAGHETCAVEQIQWKTAQGLAASLSGFDLNIVIARAIEDPRLFQWLQNCQGRPS